MSWFAGDRLCGIRRSWKEGSDEFPSDLAQKKEWTGTLPEQLKAEGYACERKKAPPSHAQKQKNEAGQDISNIPDLSPEEQQKRMPCFKRHMDSIPPEERGQEEQRITREANERGVARYDVVGC